MKLVALTAAIVMSFIIGHHAHGADLDDPGRKKVTLGTEIKRGFDTIGGLPSSADALTIVSQMDGAVRDNQRTNRDSDGFMLGARLEMWIQADIALRTIAGANSADAMKILREAAADWFRDFRSRQQTLGVTDEQLAQAIGLAPNAISPYIAAWEKR